MQVIHAAGRLESEYIAQIPDDPDIQYKLEGYLFPETYEMVFESTEHDIVQRMIVGIRTEIAAIAGGLAASRLERDGLNDA